MRKFPYFGGHLVRVHGSVPHGAHYKILDASSSDWPAGRPIGEGGSRRRPSHARFP